MLWQGQWYIVCLGVEEERPHTIMARSVPECRGRESEPPSLPSWLLPPSKPDTGARKRARARANMRVDVGVSACVHVHVCAALVSASYASMLHNAWVDGDSWCVALPPRQRPLRNRGEGADHHSPLRIRSRRPAQGHSNYSTGISPHK